MKMDRTSMSRVAEMMQWPARFEPATRHALHWWLGELVDIVPANLRRRIAALRSRYVLVVDGVGLSLVRETGHERESLGRIDLRVPQTVQRALATGRRGRGGSGHTDVILRLPGRGALRMLASLPLAAERNLDQVVGFEFERLVPFKRDDAYYTYRVVARDKAARSLHIALTALPRAEIDATVEAAARAGLRATAIEIPATEPLDPPAIVPLLTGERGAASSHARLLLAALVSFALVLAATSIVIPFLRAEGQLDALTVELAAARREADLSARLQNQIDARAHGQRFLIDRRLRTPTVTELLDILTRLTPDDSWLNELQIAGTELRLTGASVSATALLGLVDQSPSFRNAAFRSPVVQDTRLQRERFDIGAQIAPREAK
jgi:general secretion pathway protein L